jgi:hypothetical protein
MLTGHGEGAAMIRKTLLVVLLIFIVVSIVQSPHLSADYVHEGVSLITLAVQRVFTFFGSVLST